MEEEFAIIGFFGVIPLTIWIVSLYRARSHAKSMEVVDKMIDRGDVINEETVKALGGRPLSPHRDLKTGMILIAIAIALVIFGNVIPDDDEAVRIMLGIAAFPFLVGLVYSVFWFMFDRKKT